jgi:protocatechuate 3,4-dioxygenase, alpha subunit
MKIFPQTPSQTVGPFFAYSLTAEQYGYDFNSIINDSLIGSTDVLNDDSAQRIYITGQIFDGNGDTISDAIIELWQPNENGAYRDEPIAGKLDGFTGFGRVGTGTHPQHRYTFTTIKPTSQNGEAPHINVIVFMRGLLLHLYTRLYFSDEKAANAKDDLLKSIPKDRRNTLIAQKSVKNGRIVYEFNMRMQGEGETVFFDI